MAAAHPRQRSSAPCRSRACLLLALLAAAATALSRGCLPGFAQGLGAVSGAQRRGRSGATALRALSTLGQVKLNLVAGKATPAPPVGPALGSFGANIAFFVKEYNALTASRAGEVIPVIVTVYSDRSFSLELKTPPTAELLHKAVGKDRGSGKAGKDIIGTIDIDKLREIATIKLPDLNVDDIDRAMKSVHGTAVASGVEVEGYEEWLKTAVPKPQGILERYGRKIAAAPAPWGEMPPLDEGEEAEAEDAPEPVQEEA